MSQNLVNSANLANDTTFKGRVRAGIVSVAVETVSLGNAPLERLKKNLAMRVLDDPDAYVRFFLFLVADNSAISLKATQSDVADLDIYNTIKGLWDSVAAKDL